MNVFKKLVVANRRNRSTSVVSDDGNNTDEDNNFCYHQHDDGDGTGRIVGENSGSSSLSLSSLYGRRSLPPPTVVTCSKFDSDEAFAIVARAMVYRYEHDDLTEREAIEATLGMMDDKRAFIEAMDLKFTTLVSDDYISSQQDGSDAISEIIIQTRSIFDSTLKSMWREMDSDESTSVNDETLVEQRDDDDTVGFERYAKQPKTPKNLRMSPIQSSYNYKSQGEDMPQSTTCSGGNQPFKRQRRWFFAETEKHSSVTPPSIGSEETECGKLFSNPFSVKKSLPKFHFDFGGINSNSCKGNFFLMGGGGRGSHQPVQSLQLDGYSYMGGERASSYLPPTSPIRKVSETYSSATDTGKFIID